MVGNGISRYISKDKVLEKVKAGVEASLVIQLGSSQNPGGMCMCCSCCCGNLREYKKRAENLKPSEMTNSNFYAKGSEDDCTACETCLDRCQMDAITVGEVAQVDLDLCIGCGLCAVTCPSEAIKVYRKAKDKEFIPKEDMMSKMMDIYQERR
jgi:ferredoxin